MLMTATFVVGVLLAFGLWAESERLLMGFAYVDRGAFPTSWVLAIEYGVLITISIERRTG
jgi:ethanolamine transporter EutH